MQQDKITVSKKLVYRVAVGLAALLVILLLLWKQNTDRSQTPSPYNNQSSIASLKVGEPAPAFTLDSLDGGQVALSDFKGKAVLINFWASWCQPCREEIPDLIRAYTAHQAEGFIVLGINMTNIDTIPDARSFVAEFQIPYPVLLDNDGKIAALYLISGIPTSVFVNRQGTISHVQIGKLTAKQIEQLTAQILTH